MRRVKILQVTSGLNRAGVETWLMHVLRNIDRDRFQMDFLVHAEQTYDYEAEAVSLGARVIRCLQPRRPWVYAPALRRVLREYGPYDVVHSHVHDFSGLVLKVADWAGVPVRVVHSHSDSSMLDKHAGLGRRLYSSVSRRWIQRHATLRLAVSKAAGNALIRCAKDCSFEVLRCAIDCSRFHGSRDGVAIREALGIPKGACVIGYVGRFERSKNHEFFASIAAELLKLEERAWFLLVGEGPLRPGIEASFRELGIGDRATFTGASNKVPTLLQAMDVFLFPSLYEGLPLVLVEAQAAGLPCVVSTTITREADVVEPLINRLPITDTPTNWAKLTAVLLVRPSVSKSSALAQVETSAFGGLQSIRRLESLYSSQA